ncbi:DesA family fatty acid desaturase [endosymbiont of unidentified scaly snail isolate Monju]|uniref:DesA family fatty acid desaturase n=1 Tax=endosymbiont of unidentified scaly snail isolate Monju TaxID=1248727 RepID=UPI0003892C43|nr:fatty acid desaturase [endosymbiont of unidentified scaly snail isolate Monju]BAN68266.1 stearoyl-CoA desaturase [endosymbiont of unidentified scaly snail isolate Monju]
MIEGLLQLSWWQLILATLTMSHVTIVAVTVYLHRAQAHRALTLHPLVAHFFRFWLWLTTGMVTGEWVAVHRYHHARCETEDDPHSPQVKGIRKVLWQGVELYRKAIADQGLIERFSHGTPDDWLERHVYRRCSLGISLMLVIDLVLFGAAGLAVWAVQMAWIPFWAAGVINGLGHWWGYRNFASPDAATNISPWGILIGGEELHNNHHAFPSSVRLSARWFEFDIGWFYIRLLSLLGMARIRRVALRPLLDAGKAHVDTETVKAVVVHSMYVLADYAQQVIRPVARAELCRSERHCRRLARQAWRQLGTDGARLDAAARERLQGIWGRSAASQEVLLESLQQWCREAEASGIRALQEFAERVRSYRPAVAV